MRNIKCTIAYDGSAFHGWQVQNAPQAPPPNKQNAPAHSRTTRTVQGEVEAGLARMHSRSVQVQAAGRTDSGVHARGQVINFYSELDSIDMRTFPRALSSFLPKDIAVLRAEEVDHNFHARFSARRRVYKYYIYPSPVRMPQYRMYSLRLPYRPNTQLLNEMACVLTGEHDFTSFSAYNEQAKSAECRVYAASFYPQGDFLVFRIEARSFLWKMVRSIVGSLLEYEKNGYTAERVRAILAARDRSSAGMTAAARGLFLDSVVY